MKSQRAENAAREQSTRPKVEVKIVLVQQIQNGTELASAFLEQMYNDNWQIAACVADSSGVNLVYTMVRVVAPEPAPKPPGIAVR